MYMLLLKYIIQLFHGITRYFMTYGAESVKVYKIITFFYLKKRYDGGEEHSNTQQISLK